MGQPSAGGGAEPGRRDAVEDVVCPLDRVMGSVGSFALRENE
ncbi:hypothetical protein ABZ341_27700 [Streptomyces sp. NPDC006173]